MSTKSASVDEGKTSTSSSYESKFTSNPSHESSVAATTTTAASKTTDLGASHIGHVSLTSDQQLLHRAVGHLYSKIIQPKDEGGWLEWMNEHCVKFDVRKKSEGGGEHSLLYTELHKEYEEMVEAALVEFTAQEGIKDHEELYLRIFRAKDDKKFEKTVNLLLAAANYKKFVALMKRKHRMFKKKQKSFFSQLQKSSSASAASSSSSALPSDEAEEGPTPSSEGHK